MAPVKSGRRSAAYIRSRVGYWPYLVPGVLLFIAVIVVPFAMNLYFSFTSWRGIGEPEWIGLENYLELASDSTFWISFRNSIAMVVAIVVIPTAIGLLLAATFFDFIGRRFGPRVASVLRALYYLPQVVPVVAAGLLWTWILQPQTGGLNTVLRAVGLDSLALNWLGDPETALPTVMSVLVWFQIGYPIVVFMAALERVDPELYEAAEMDGAPWFTRMRAITIPQIRPEIFVVTLTGTISALQVFAPIYVLTGGGPENSTNVPSYFSYTSFFTRAQVGYGAAIATVLALVVLLVALVMIRFQARSEKEDSEL